MMPSIVRALASLAVGGAGFTVISTLIFLYGTGLAPHFPYPVYQWWLYAACCYDKPVVFVWLLISALPPIVLGGFLVYRQSFARGRSLRRTPSPNSQPAEPPRAATGANGHARWATPREMRRRWPGPDPTYGGVVIGEAYDPQGDKGPFHPHNRRSWGTGGRRRLLIDPCYEGPTHGIIVAASGGFKSMCFVSTLLHWKTSAVVLDPAHELAPMVRVARERMGHRVFVLDTKTAATCGFNVLGWIDTASTEAEGDVGAVVEWISGATPASSNSTGRFFKNRGKAVVKCFIAHILWEPSIPTHLKTLTTMRDWISEGQVSVQQRLTLIAASSRSRLARQIAGGFAKVPEEAWGGIVASADDDTSWLTTLANAQLVSGDSFHASDITRGTVDVFIQLSLKVLQSSAGLARCITGALLNAVYEADGDVVGRVLFLIDEAKQLGYMGSLKVGRDAGRKAGITILLGYQSEAQISEQWGGRDGKEEWYQTVSWTSFSVINEVQTAKHISEACGTYSGLSWSESFRRRFSFRNGGNISYSDRPIPLVRAQEILSDMRTDAQIIMPGSGHRPVRCGRAIYFRRSEMVARVTPSHFVKRDRDISTIPSPLDDLEDANWPPSAPANPIAHH